jgi:hypothetical protein
MESKKIRSLDLVNEDRAYSGFRRQEDISCCSGSGSGGMYRARPTEKVAYTWISSKEKSSPSKR